MTELEKMLMGKIYDPSDTVLSEKRLRAHRLCRMFNALDETEEEQRNAILGELIPNCGEGSYLLGPIQFDYGEFTSFGTNCFANFNLTILDCCPVNIGNDVFFGPNCSLATPIHPLLAEERKMRFKEDGTPYDLEYAAPINIEDGCWLASNVTVCGGVTIGRGSVIGAGSVVTRDIPSGVFAAGNPCRVIREITEEDSIMKKQQLF